MTCALHLPFRRFFRRKNKQLLKVVKREHPVPFEGAESCLRQDGQLPELSNLLEIFILCSLCQEILCGANWWLISILSFTWRGVPIHSLIPLFAAVVGSALISPVAMLNFLNENQGTTLHLNKQNPSLDLDFKEWCELNKSSVYVEKIKAERGQETLPPIKEKNAALIIPISTFVQII